MGHPAIWYLACHDNSGKTTVFTCFGNSTMKMPLAYSRDKLAVGSVASLQFDSTHITSLPDPNIPGATWFAIASEFPDGGGMLPKSEPREFLNELIQATYPASQTAPSLTNLLNNEPNDAIVTLNSQLYNSRWGLSHTFKYLSHAYLPLGDAVSILIPFLDNDAVTDSGAVNVQVRQWLLGGSLGGASPSNLIVNKDEMMSKSPAATFAGLPSTPLTLTPDRLSIIEPNHPVELAQPSELTINVGNREVTTIAVSQSNAGGYFHNVRGAEHLGVGAAKITRDDGDIKTIEITPMQVGVITEKIAVEYSDGAIAEKEVSLNVVPSSTNLAQFRLNDLPAIPIVLSDGSKKTEQWLRPRVSYKGLKYPINLPDCSQVQLTVEQPPDDPIISVDRDGLIHGIKSGTAVIIGKFGNAEDRVTVHVYDTNSAPKEYE